MLSIVSVFLFVGVLAAVYWLGVTQGKHLQRKRDHEREYKSVWMLREAMRLWSPWTGEEAEWMRRLAAAYDDRGPIDRGRTHAHR